MEEKQHNDNDIVFLKGKYNDIDNVRERVLKNITEYRLGIIQQFMFGGSSKEFGDTTIFVNPAIKQIERFMFVWMTELTEDTRKAIINYHLYNDKNSSRSYKDYTNSPAWKYLSSVVKLYKNYTCELCHRQSSPAHLVVHHNTYEHLGSELIHLEDVSVLCNPCHQKVHNIKEVK